MKWVIAWRVTEWGYYVYNNTVYETSCLRNVWHPLKTDVATGLFQRLTTFAVIMRFASLRYLSDWSQIAERSEPYSRIWVEDTNSRIRFGGHRMRFAAHCEAQEGVFATCDLGPFWGRPRDLDSLKKRPVTCVVLIFSWKKVTWWPGALKNSDLVTWGGDPSWASIVGVVWMVRILECASMRTDAHSRL